MLVASIVVAVFVVVRPGVQVSCVNFCAGLRCCCFCCCCCCCCGDFVVVARTVVVVVAVVVRTVVVRTVVARTVVVAGEYCCWEKVVVVGFARSVCCCFGCRVLC